MSDDLISRKSLIGTERLLMTDIVKNNEVARYILEQVLYDIEHTPVSFDKEKVIEELRSEAQRWHESGVEFKDENEKGVSAGFRLATRIVEKGGIE